VTGLPEGWRLFEHDAAGYEDWYATARGRRADQAERALLDRLLAPFAGAQNALEVGCGTGHFTRWLAGRIPHVVGLDRAPAMLAEARLRSPRLRLIQADAHALPIRSQTIDLAFFVLTLEFLEDPAVALAEAVRVARRGLIVVALNRWSVGGLSRRWGPDARRLVLGRARDFTLMSLRALASAAAGPRLRVCRWASALFPDGLVAGPARIPLGGVIGLSVELGPVTGAAGDADTRNEREDGQWLQVPRAFTSQRRISRRRRATCIGQWSASWRSWRPWTEEWPRGAAGRSTHRNRRRAQRRSVMRRSERLGPRGRAQGHGAAVRDEGGEPIGQGFLTTNARRRGGRLGETRDSSCRRSTISGFRGVSGAPPA
jgi:SAM-dependent methyltransferase